ncbi:MAG: FkbM family methyltransferase [Bacteroidales bacterium]
MKLKHNIRAILNFLHLDITKNLEYDRLTKLIIKRVVKKDSVCIDIGCHKGEILDLILQQSPMGGHYGFEPIPLLYKKLIDNYSPENYILPYAIGENPGKASFQYVKNAPAYSGLQKRKYAVKNPEIEEIEVEIIPLDNIIPSSIKIDFIKIDVEGAEYGVLKSAKRIIRENKPIIIFECGLGASDFYGTKPEEVFNFLTSNSLKISILKSWLKNKSPLSLNEFCDLYIKNKEYYFIAHP